MQLTSPNLSNSSQVSKSSSSTFTRPARCRRRRRRCRRSPPSLTPSSISPPSQTPNINETQFYSSSSLPSSSYSPPLIFLSAVVPLPTFRGIPGECPVAHLTRFNRLFPSANTSSLSQISRNFSVTLLDDAALWYELSVEPHPSMSWDETKSAFLRAFRLPEFAKRARAELISLRQGDGESVTAYHLRMRWILKRWDGHGLPEALVRGLFVDGLREELRDRVMIKKPETVEEAVRLATDWEGARAVRCGFCEGMHGEKECEGRRKMREEWMKRKMRGEEKNSVVEGMERVVSIGRKSQCQCLKHQCWKKYERSGSAVAVTNADAGDANMAAAAPVGANSIAERIGGMMMTVGGFFLNLLFLCMQQ